MESTQSAPLAQLGKKAGGRGAMTRGHVDQTLLLIGVCAGMSGGFAGIYFATFGLFLKPITASFAWSRTEVASAPVLAVLGTTIAGPFIGRLIDRYGASLVIGLAVLVFSASTASLSLLPPNRALLLACSFVIGLVGVATTTAGYLVVVARNFEGRVGLAFGIGAFGQATGAAALPILAQRLIDVYGWRGAYVGLGALALLLGSLGWCAVRRNGQRATGSGASDPAPAVVGDSFAQALRSPRLWGLAVVMVLVSAAGMGALLHQAAWMTDRGLTPSDAAKLVGVAGLGAMVARLCGGFLLDHLQARFVASAVFVVGAVGLLIMSQAESFQSFAISATFIGLLIGVDADISPFFARRYFGLASFGAISGFLFGAFGVGTLIGSLGFAAAFDRFGSYTGVLLAGATACLLCSAGVLALGRYRF